MKSILLKCLVLALVGVINFDVVGQPVKRANEKAIAYLTKFRLEYVNQVLNKKPGLLQTYYIDSIRLMPPFQKTVIGKSNVRAYHTAFANRFTVRDYTRTELEVLDLNGQILETGTFTMRVLINKTGKEQVLRGKYLDLWIALGNGELKLLTEVWNYDEFYADIHEQLRFDEVPAIHTALLPNVPVNNSISFELAALNRLLDEAVTNHDGNTWSLYYADDAMLLASYYPICSGKRAVDEYINTHVKELPVFEALDIRNDRIDYLGNYVIEYASHIASWKNGNSSGVSLGKNIRIWKRDPDHSLKLFRSIGTYD